MPSTFIEDSDFLDGCKGLILSGEEMHTEQRVFRDMVRQSVLHEC